MKILHLSHLYHPSIGGNQLHTQLMSEQLAAFGDQVHVFTSNAFDIPDFDHPKNAGKLPDHEVINGVNVHRFKINHYTNSFLVNRLFKVRGGYWLRESFMTNAHEFMEHGPTMFGMLPAIGLLKPDVMLATNNYYFTTYACYLAKKLFNIKFVLMPVTHHFDRWTESPYLIPLFEQADLIIACTEFERKLLSSQGVDKNKIVTLPLGIRRESFDDADGNIVRKKYGVKDGPTIAYIGRKTMHKGIETLIDAMPLVWKEFPYAQLLLAGHKEEKFAPVLEAALRRYSSEQKAKVINVDDFPLEEKKHFFDAIDILAMPSNIDCFGLVYLEAWACGRPVIACRNTPQETIITDGHDGLLVEWKNSQQLAESLLKLLRNPQQRMRMGENGRQTVETKYNLNVYGKLIRDEYTRLLNLAKI